MQGNLLFKGDTSVGATFVIFQILVQGQKTVVVGKVAHIFLFFFSPANCKRLLLLLLSFKVDNHLSSQAHTDYQLMIDTLKKVKVNANYAQTDFKMLQQGKTVQACCNRKCLSADDVLP